MSFWGDMARLGHSDGPASSLTHIPFLSGPITPAAGERLVGGWVRDPGETEKVQPSGIVRRES